MTEKSWLKGGDILHELQKLKAQKVIWEQAQSLIKVTIRCKGSNIDDIYRDADTCYIHFDSLRAFTIGTIQKRITELQKEFDEL